MEYKHHDDLKLADSSGVENYRPVSVYQLLYVKSF